MEIVSSVNLLSRIQELEDRLAEAEQLIDAIKAGEVDAFALNKNNQPEIFTLQSGDYAYRVLVENFSEGALNLSEDGLIVYTNTSFHETLNLTYEKVIGKSIFQFIHPDSVETFNELFRKGLAGQSKGELNLIAGKKMYPVYVSLTSLYPTLHTVGMIVSDLSEKKEHEKILLQHQELMLEKKLIEKNEKDFRQLANVLPPLVWKTDAHGKQLFASERWKEFTGLDPGNESSFEKIVHPNELQGMFAVWNESLSTGNTYRYQVRLKNKNGNYHWFQVHGEPVTNDSGEIESWMVAFTDVTPEVTARKKIEESEKLFRFIADSMPQKVWTADAEGNRNYFNKQWLDYTGMTLEELQSEWKKIIHPDDLSKTNMHWQQALETGNDFEVEDRKRDKDGIYKWHLSRASAFRDETGEIKMWIGTNTEVEKQKMQALEFENAVKQRTAELQQANEELKKMNKELESFTYVSSHDLQEPLRKIQTFIGRILEKENKNLTSTGKDHFRRITIAANRMQTLILDLLAFSRINSGERKFELIDLHEFVEEVKAEFKETIREKHATIETKDLNEQVHVIRFQFRQLLHNLLSNSLKFSKPGVPTHIIIKSELLPFYLPLAGKGKVCHITFSDNGIGFEQQYSKQIFQLFQKLHSKDEYPGTGLGLAIVKKIVDNHYGNIAVTSELGKGATFEIYLPATQVGNTV